MGVIDYIAIIAGFLTIISVCINIIQWRTKKGLITTLKSRSQAAYNYFFQIAQHSDKIRELSKNNYENQLVINIAIQQACSINGISDAARCDIISYCREHLNFIPVKEHPARPHLEKLPKPRQYHADKTMYNLEIEPNLPKKE